MFVVQNFTLSQSQIPLSLPIPNVVAYNVANGKIAVGESNLREQKKNDFMFVIRFVN
jgi:hypothetical protein